MSREDELYQFGTDLAVTAGKRLLPFFGQVEREEKGKNDVVTAADRAIEQFVVSSLSAKFPGCQIISEETLAGADKIAGECWVLDPLDGTVGFAAGIRFFAISLALLKDGDPIMGWIYDPVHDELFQARKGGGFFLNGKKAGLAPDPRLLPAVLSSGLIDQAARNGWSGELFDTAGKFRILGSQALHLAYVASGRVRMALNWNCRIWDDAAGSLFVQEAGGKYSNCYGRPIFPLKSGDAALAGKEIRTVAGPPAEYEQMMVLLRKHLKTPA
jgi:myo-inositol-1(or 4)-monophosphatase